MYKHFLILKEFLHTIIIRNVVFLAHFSSPESKIAIHMIIKLLQNNNFHKVIEAVAFYIADL
jgi:hypothetical protein